MSNLLALSSAKVGSWFQSDYLSARTLFLEMASHSVNQISSRSWALPAHAELSIDTRWIGNHDAETVVVILSATHGVEGYCGSAVQSFLLHWLDQQDMSLPSDTAMLLVHSLNPWGMDWARRCNEQGVDLNRNFIDFTDLPSPDKRYNSVLEALTSTDQRKQRLATLAMEMGQTVFDQLFSGGQYHCAWAPFYGGQSASFSHQVIDELIAHWKLEGRRLVVIDVHSGLGPWAHGELISDHPAGSAGARFAQQLFGPAVAETQTGESCSVPKLGLLDYRWHQLMQQRGCFLTLEFGSYGTDALFEVLINEHLFWRDHPNPAKDDLHYQQHRLAMIKHFCPSDPFWQQAVLFKTWQVVTRALMAGAL
ncbi:DUF2817 domain-containing protein [Litoribrevibacter albus]|uniref:DUF2817 domain-containing protein n=1 Tax=Litoribrevibacter albus TaxID=1473156 RepID=A0AA37W4C0_9GAMM|nr:DUF2817 domain-containing protein [Litoribrevibacter albus]GLQ29665.1 hypothetical protein GCM10007876_01430 [Litoribrevibacter albus]